MHYFYYLCSGKSKKEMKTKLLQNCGDYLIIDRKSEKKVRNRYYYEGHFEGYSRTIYFRLDSAQYGNVSNPDKRDEYGFLCDESAVDSNIYFVWKNMARRCYDKKCQAYPNYGGIGVTVSDEFKIYSNFKNWYIQESDGNSSLELDKDCLSYLNDIPKTYSKDTCILIPPELNTFISTIGKGIYLTKSSSYCVRLRRKFKKINKNFKTYKEAAEFKKKEDIEYLELLLGNYDLSINVKNIIREYVKVFRY